MKLVLPITPTSDRQAVHAAASARSDVDVHIISCDRVPAHIRDHPDVRVYGSESFATRAARSCQVALLSPPRNWIADVPSRFTGRQVAHMTLGEAKQLRFPQHVQPIAGAAVPARVYRSADDLPGPALDHVPVRASSPLDVRVCARLFAADGEVRTLTEIPAHPNAQGLRNLTVGERRNATLFAELTLAVFDRQLPSAVALDVAMLANGRPVLLDAVAPWHAQLYRADPARALDVILAASRPAAALTPDQRQFAVS